MATGIYGYDQQNQVKTNHKDPSLISHAVASKVDISSLIEINNRVNILTSQPKGHE